MKKQNVIISIIIIVTCISGIFTINFNTRNILKIQSDSIYKQVYSKTDNVLKKIEEENEKRKKLDMLISKLLSQISANMSEEYWLFETQKKTREMVSLDIYVDNAENIKNFAVVPSDKLIVLNEKGEELCFFNILHYTVTDGNIEGLWTTTGRDLRFREEIETALKDIEKVIDCKLNYVKTIENYEWPQAKQPRYKLEDLQSTKIYQDFELCINKQFYFPTGAEIYLGLWNGYSNRVRMMYRTLGSDEKIHYYSTEMNLDGQRCNFVNEVTEEIYERFKLISVKMM